MQRFLFVLVLVVVGVIGLSYYLGWWSFTSDSGDGKSHITVTVDKDKIKQDEKKALEKAKDVGQGVKDKLGTPTETGKE